MLNSLLVFDIETIPDVDSCTNLLNISNNTSVEERREALTKYHLEITSGQNPFLRQPFHQVVVISFLLCNISHKNGYEVFTLQEIRSGGTLGSNEKELVRGFFNYMSEKKPRLVSFNGRTFDMPVLKYRAMVHGIQAEYLHKAGDKWNSYNQRYSSDWHCDLLESLSDFGASARVKMNEVCAAFSLPGKIGVDGSQVTSLYDSGKLQEIRDYCETDVVNTYLIYLRFMYHQGRITAGSYNKNIEELLLECEKKEHLKKFKKEWEAACGGKFDIESIT
ncbi:3'-5' exonuclease [Wolbachia endosymbiont of Ctenocephalides felis wCfeT]|uniref:3'-5' exonuclease n=1 Tax=Wolbachia endosymbiont of Ctenocephalides felis wCfeT TaxID=2732593 RepID=UPI0014463002|nr:3'-5' exonuclease [Wolbachia endosymbiont of Ctenocephalides felis wCfeT]